MTTLAFILYILVVLLILCQTGIALRWIRTASILRMLCRDLLTVDWIRKGKQPEQDALDAEIDARIEEMRKEEQEWMS